MRKAGQRGLHSTVTDLIVKKMDRLDVVKRGDLRLVFTNIEPNIKITGQKPPSSTISLKLFVLSNNQKSLL